jgi:hypothetical protein
LQVLSKVEIAKDATDLLGSVINVSSSFMQSDTSLGCFAATLLIYLRAANLKTGFPVFYAICTKTWKATSTSITVPNTSKSSHMLLAASSWTASSSLGKHDSI